MRVCVSAPQIKIKKQITLNLRTDATHNADYVAFLICLYDKPQTFDLAPVLDASRHNIDSSSIDTTVPKNVRKLGNIFLNTIESPCKEFPQVMRKHFGFFHPCSLAELFHLSPYTTAVKWLPIPAKENCSSLDTLLFRVMQQLFSQFTRYKNRSGLAFAVHGNLTTLNSFYGEIF